MFLESFSDSKLLPERSNTHIFKLIPLQTKAPILREMIRYLDSDIPGLMNTLYTDAHVQFMMEHIGASFTLPIIDHHETVQSALNIYSSWLLERRKPAPLLKKEEYYYTEIFAHLSMLFRDRYPHEKKGSNISQVQAGYEKSLQLRRRALRLFTDRLELHAHSNTLKYS